MTTEKAPPPAADPTLKDVLTKEEAAMLWQLLNAPGAGTPFAAAHLGAAFYAKVKAAAVAHGVVAP